MREKLIRLVKKIMTFILIGIPNFMIYFGLAILAYRAYQVFENNYSFTEIASPLISAILITTAVSSLSFNYSRNLNKSSKNYKEIVYCGERFFHSTVLIGTSLILLWSASYLIGISNETEILSKLYYLAYFIGAIALGLLMNSARYLSHGLKSIEEILNAKEIEGGSRSDFFKN